MTARFGRRGPVRSGVSLAAVAILAAANIRCGVAAGEVPEGSEPDISVVLTTDEVDRAVDRGLAFLAATQTTGGYWESHGHGRRNTGIASLAVMAFLARGYTPGEGKYGGTIDRGIAFVLGSVRQDGLIAAGTSHGPMYSHGIATLMLCEVLGMTSGEREKRVRGAAVKGIEVILKAQAIAKDHRHAGGWRYHAHSRDSDISCTGWQLMSLRAAKNIGCDVPLEAIEHAIAYVKLCAVPGGGFAYMPGGGPNMARTGTGIVSLEVCGAHNTREALRGAEYLLRASLGREDHFYYGVYYCSQAMFQMGDRYWVPFKKRLEAALLPLQRPDGSFQPGRSNESAAGLAYSTAMACLALSVQYRYLPIYQR